MITYLKGLRRESGGYADTFEGEVNLRATLSVLKALIELEAFEVDARVVDFVRSCRHANGGFAIRPEADPSPFDTADGLICLRALGQDELLTEYLPPGLAFMSAHAETQFDHFMLIATYEECDLPGPVPAVTLEFFMAQLQTGLAERKVVNTAIAAASLIRAGQTLTVPQTVAALLLSGQNADGGFGDDGKTSLFGTYCAMRTLVLLNVLPDTRRLLGYLDALKTDLGYTDAPGGKTTAGATYQNLSMRTWVRQLQRDPVRAARAGDVEYLQRWLASGGDPNLYDSDGWTVLLAAAARGQPAVVDLLLNPQIPGVPPADSGLRYSAADALPLYMAGQAGDLDTVRLLLKANPEHLHAISSVNGHTVLLQAAFYGKAKHLALAEYVLDHAAEIAGLPAERQPEEQARLLAATNVRGYNALGMQDLWHNGKMKALLQRYTPAGGEPAQALETRRRAYHENLLLAIATPQALTENLLEAIEEYLEAEGDEPAAVRRRSVAERRMDAVLAQPAFEINRPGGDLQMPPLVSALTGVDVGQPARAQRRRALVRKLLEAGADPAVRERHPMAVGAVIRASVLNNFGLLQLIAEYMPAQTFAREMNVSPAVNGLTAMHDAVHRALTSPPAEREGHLAQIAWMIARGARLDIPDHVGQTQVQLAEAAQDDPAFPPENVQAVLTTIRAACPPEITPSNRESFKERIE